jgi:hypothetical protein
MSYNYSYVSVCIKLQINDSIQVIFVVLFHFVTEKFSQDQACTLYDTRANTPINLETECHYLMHHTIMPDGGLPLL